MLISDNLGGKFGGVLLRLKSYLVNKMLNSWEQSDREKLNNKPVPNGVAENNDVAYAADNIRGHLLDTYYPSQVEKKLPVLIDIHGGGFMSGDKELNRLFGLHMAKRGFLVFNLNYRLALSGVKVANQINDISIATKWIGENLDRLGGDYHNILLCGHSAGAVLAVIEALNSTSPRLRKIYGVSENVLTYKGLLLDCGMMAFYQNTIGYWGMRTMVFEKGYRHKENYKNMIWAQIPELSSLPKTFLISNKGDELKSMTLQFKDILDRNKVENVLDFQINCALGHMAIIYDAGSKECSDIIDRAIEYLLE